MEKVFEILVNGVSLGGIYALIALGFVLIYKSTGVINFAQGEFSMVGAYICFSLIVHYDLPYMPAFLLTIVCCGVLGLVVEYLILRHMVGEPMFSLIMVTVGLASILTSLVGVIWGHEAHAIPSPLSGKTCMIGNVVVSQVNIYIVCVSLVLFGLFFFFFKKSSLGIGMRATSEDQDTAQLMGFNVRKIFGMSWAISAVVAATGGIFMAEQTMVYNGMGNIGLRAFGAAILGGMDSLGGAILAGFIIGVVESAAGVLIGGEVKEVVSFVILLIVLMIRPFGLFGTKEIERV